MNVIQLERERKIRLLKMLIKRGLYSPTPLEQLLKELSGG